MAGKGKIRRFLIRALGAVAGAVLLVLAAVSLILAKPEETEKNTPAASPQPARSASPALEVHSESDLYRLVSDFPAPVMSFMSGSGMDFVSALSSDAALDGQFARTATLYWQTADGLPVTLQSIWPADALSLLEGGFHFSPVAGPVFLGSASVRMEKDRVVRIHTATDQGLYVLLLPDSLSGQLSGIIRSIQLYTAHPDE